MATLTRRRDLNIPQECRRVYCGDIDAGSRPGECSYGTSETFELARATIFSNSSMIPPDAHAA
jgi:hypothetical protein